MAKQQFMYGYPPPQMQVRYQPNAVGPQPMQGYPYGMPGANMYPFPRTMATPMHDARNMMIPPQDANAMPMEMDVHMQPQPQFQQTPRGYNRGKQTNRKGAARGEDAQSGQFNYTQVASNQQGNNNGPMEYTRCKKEKVQSMGWGIQNTALEKMPWKTPGSLPPSHYMKPGDVKLLKQPKPDLAKMVDDARIVAGVKNGSSCGRFSRMKVQLTSLEDTVEALRADVKQTVHKTNQVDGFKLHNPENNKLFADCREMLHTCVVDLTTTLNQLKKNRDHYTSIVGKHEPDVIKMISTQQTSGPRHPKSLKQRSTGE